MSTDSNHTPLKKTIDRQFESIDDEISADIEFILKNPVQPLYRSEHYGIKDHSIKILVPKIEYPGSKKLIKSSDHIRFLLSLYPDKQDLRSIDRLIMRPRHIEAGGVELMALFIRSTKHLYTICIRLTPTFSRTAPPRRTTNSCLLRSLV
jgi:hypothetical protein